MEEFQNKELLIEWFNTANSANGMLSSNEKYKLCYDYCEKHGLALTNKHRHNNIIWYITYHGDKFLNDKENKMPIIDTTPNNENDVIVFNRRDFEIIKSMNWAFVLLIFCICLPTSSIACYYIGLGYLATMAIETFVFIPFILYLTVFFKILVKQNENNKWDAPNAS